MFQLTPVCAFQDNYIWMLQHPSHPGLAVAVDPGQSAPVTAWLKQRDLKLAAVLVTHHHPDHTGGILDLTDESTPIYGPNNSPYKAITKPLDDGDSIELLGQILKVKTVPGHTLDHLCYYTTDAETTGTPQLFCGDTLFIAGCGRLFEGTAQQMQEAMAFFRSLTDDTQVCCAHEYTLSNLAFAVAVEPNNSETKAMLEHCQQLRNKGLATVPGRIGTEKQINPFMRYDHPEVINAAERANGQRPSSDTQVLAAIRQWKDRF